MVTFYRRLPKFDYIRPKSIDEILNVLSNGNNGKYRVYAGGTDLIPQIKKRALNAPEILVDLKGVPDLDYIAYNDQDGLRIGALTTIRSVVTSSIVADRFPILSMAAGSIASAQIQNRGTIGGNICNAVPSADSVPALLCLDARLLIVSKESERTVRIEDFFIGPNQTVLKSNELLKEIQIPNMPDNSHGAYVKLSTRKRMDLAVVGVGAALATEGDIFKNVRIGLGAVAPTPMRAKKSEVLLTGAKIDDKIIVKAARNASEESSPIDDHRASAEYRKMMVEVLVKRVIGQILSN